MIITLKQHRQNQEQRINFTCSVSTYVAQIENHNVKHNANIPYYSETRITSPPWDQLKLVKLSGV